MQTQAQEGTRKTRGRKDQGIEAVPNSAPVMEVIEDLVHLHHKKEAANETYNAAVKKTAERAGLLSAVVNKFVSAKAGDKFEDEKKKVSQLALVFDAAEALEPEEEPA